VIVPLQIFCSKISRIGNGNDVGTNIYIFMDMIAKEGKTKTKTRKQNNIFVHFAILHKHRFSLLHQSWTMLVVTVNSCCWLLGNVGYSTAHA